MKLFLPGLLLLAIILSGCKVARHPSQSQPISHQLWDSLVKTHVDEKGLVDYKSFLKDSSRLLEYTRLLSKHHPNDKNWSKPEQLAYWINAYNAFTVQLVLRHYPVESIKDIKNGIPFVNTVWDIKFIEIEGAVYDLNNLEHGIVRAQFPDPRIHFALNCASVSCPPLRAEAYTSADLDNQLNDQARAFLADTTKNKITASNLALSKIFSWYRGDFTRKGSIIEYLNLFAPVEINPEAKIDYLDYDWGLNQPN